MADLRVQLYGHLVGTLVGTDPRSFAFKADASAVEVFGLGSTILSESVPLEAAPNKSRSHASRRRNYFAELLPEGRILSALATRIRVSERDVIGLLASYGRDVAGAVQIFDPERPGEPTVPYATSISNAELEVLLQNTAMSPLGNMSDSGKSSLAGVQDKIVVALIDGAWHQVHDGYPSTHIIKPESRDFPSIIFDEEYGCRLARHLGLAKHTTEIRMFNSVAGLAIERYDRTTDTPPERIHQEDMSQALGARGSEKYQEHGGRVSLRRIAQLFAKNGDGNSLERLLVLNTLAVAIGNLDMHAKNISLVHYRDGSSGIAPAYDMVPMRHLHNDGRMALAVNGKYVHAQISESDIVEEARSWRMRKDPRPLVENTLEMISTFVDATAPHKDAHGGLAQDIKRFTQNLLNKKPAG